MSRTRGVACFCATLGLASMSLLACKPDAGRVVPGGQRCGESGKCEAGWLCYESFCRRICNAHQDCAKTEACEPGVCLPVADYVCDEDIDCNEPSECESILDAECYAGECHYSPAEAGLPCDDGNSCTSNDACNSTGACRGEAVVCNTPPTDYCLEDDSKFRHYANTGTCNPSQGSCEYGSDDTPCADCRHECQGLPYAPGNLLAAAGDAQVTLSWESVDDALSYNVYASQTEGDTSVVPVSAAASPYLHTDLSNGATYYYAVSAVVAVGEGDVSAEVSAQPRISAPTQASARSGDAEVALTWEPVPGAESYNVYWALEAGVTTSSDHVLSEVISDFVHTQLENGTTYYYAVTAVDGPSESVLSPEVSASPRISAPVHVSARGGDQHVTLSWNPVPGADTYGVYWSLQPGVTTLGSNRLMSTTSAHVHAPLANSTTYYYALTALDGPSESELSDEISATTLIDTGTKLVASDAETTDSFGWSVALSGEYAIVGVFSKHGGDGAAYVFHRTGANTWDAGTKLVAPDAQAYDYFGQSMAVSGDYAIVGAYRKDGGESEPIQLAGAAYVFHRTGENVWDSVAKLTAPDAQASDEFGKSVALSNDYAIVGATGEDGGDGDRLRNAGAAYVFQRAGENSWDSVAKLTAPDARAGDSFGCSVALSGDHAIVGAMAGGAHVFLRTGEASWDSVARLLAPDVQLVFDRFGWSVALNGDYAIVGAMNKAGGDGDPVVDAGAAYVFHRIGANTWNAGTKLVAPDAQAHDSFGRSVAVSGDYAIVGASGGDGGDGDPVADAGAAYVFHRIGANTWDAGTKLAAPDAQTDDGFGWSVALDGDSALVGARGEDGGDGDPLSNAGAGYVYEY